MSDSDWVTSAAELRDSFAGVAMPEPPQLATIIARGRRRRRRRMAALTPLPLAGASALAAAAFGVLGTGGSTSTLQTFRTAAFVLHHNGNGTDTLTLNPGELFDPSQLQGDLAKDGIPARVTVGSYCTSDPAPSGFDRIVSGPGPGTFQPGSSESPTITIDASAMPTGTELSVGEFTLSSGERQAQLELIDTSDNTCVSTPPALDAGTPGLGVLFGGSTDAGS